jgi:hypothetical protein
MLGGGGPRTGGGGRRPHLSSVQHLHSGKLAYINACYIFRVAHSRKLSIVKNFISIVLFLLCFFKKIYFYDSSFTMSASTATIAKKKATTVPATLGDAFISDVVLEQVFDKVSGEPI